MIGFLQHLVLRSLLAGAILGLSYGCDKEVEASRELVRTERSPVYLPLLDTTDAPNDSILLYVDASESMAGFVGCRVQQTRFDVVLTRTATDLGLTGVVLFGEPDRPGVELFSPTILSHQVLCPQTFTRLANPDYRVVERASEDSGAVHLYFTDGVQSAGPAATPSPTVRALQQWVSGGRGLTILAFRSEFSGSAWSEQLGRMVGDVKVKDRPFYIFVLAPSPGAADAVVRRLSPSLRSMAQVIRFPEEPVQCRLQHRQPLQQRDAAIGWGFMRPEVVERFFGGGAPLATFTCDIEEGYPLATVLPQAEPRYWIWTGSAFQSAAPPAGFAVAVDSIQDEPARVSAVLHARFQPDARTNWGVLGLRVGAETGRLLDALQSLSTHQDAFPEQFSKTYRFDWLIEHLVRSHLERASPEAELFTTLQYRD